MEASNILLMVVVPFIYLLGYWFHPLNALLKKLFDILIQIFRNLQNFPWSWIARIATFSMSEQRFMVKGSTGCWSNYWTCRQLWENYVWLVFSAWSVKVTTDQHLCRVQNAAGDDHYHVRIDLQVWCNHGFLVIYYLGLARNTPQPGVVRKPVLVSCIVSKSYLNY